MTAKSRPPGVDVVVPCYNYASFLPGCIASLLGQTGADVRVLILDDASTDDSEVVGTRLARADSRVEYRRHFANRGHIATYNEGLLEWAERRYALLISADDLLAVGALGSAVGLLDSHPEAGFCHGEQLVFRDDSELPLNVRQSEPIAGFVEPGLAFLEQVAGSGQNPVATPTVVVRTELQHKVGGYRAELPHAGDLEMWLRLATHASVGRVGRVQAFKRLHGRNMQADYVATVLPDLEQRALAFRTTLFDAQIRVPSADTLLVRASRALAVEGLWAASRALDSGNAALCDSLLRFARREDPDVVLSRAWRRVQFKRMLGGSVCRNLSKLRKSW